MTTICNWCGDSVDAKRADGYGLTDRYVRLEPHLDIYPTRACEGGNRVFDTWYQKFLPREVAAGAQE
jgi:hypothetical protein